MFFITDSTGFKGLGATLEEAWDSYELDGGYDINDCKFYECKEIKVERKFHIVVPKTETKKPVTKK